MAVMTLGGVRPEDSLAISLAARALQIVVWLPVVARADGQTGAVSPADPTRFPTLRLRPGQPAIARPKSAAAIRSS